MNVKIEIPKEFECDFENDRFEDCFNRVLVDIERGGMCGRYEKETIEMFIKVFKEAKKGGVE